MKIIRRAILFAWTPFAVAQGVDKSTPTELLEARAHYEAAIAAATKPIRERYLVELEQLKTTAYFTRNFDLAKAVVDEIVAMGDTGTDGTGSPEDRLKERVINTTWLWWGGRPSRSCRMAGRDGAIRARRGVPGKSQAQRRL